MSKYRVKVGIIGGSGLDDASGQFLKERKVTTVEDAANAFGSPSGNLYHGVIAGVDVVLLSRHGEKHHLSPSMVNYRANIEALRNAGCTHVIVSTACGSLSEEIHPGQLVIPDSFIDRTNNRIGTMFDGHSDDYPGVCHMPMEPAFDPSTSDILEQAARELKLPIRRGGTVVTIEGPRFSSKAESNLFRLWGAHLVNMTVCPEAILAKEAGLLYASVAVATDYDCWHENEKTVHAADVLVTFQQNVKKVTELLAKAVELIGQKCWDLEIEELRTLIKTSTVSQ